MRELPGGRELLELAGGREDVELVGGAVRDLLLGRTPRELDVVVADDAPAFARELARAGNRLCGGPAGALRHHRARALRDGARLVGGWSHRHRVPARRVLPAPGALPDVRAGTIEEDLRRRDFTVNAIALFIGGPRTGELSTVPRAFEDLARSTSARAARAELPG